MHVCFLCNEYPPAAHGGIGSFTQALARGLAASGHRVTVVGTYRDGDSAGLDRGVSVLRLREGAVRGGGFILNGRAIRSALRRLHLECPIDLVEGPEPSLSALPRARPWRTIIRMHGGHHFYATTLGGKPAPWRGWLERRSFRNADALCAVSQYVADMTRRLLHLDGRPIEILPNPVDTGVFRPSPGAEEPGLVLFAGTICEKKGIRGLVQAMPRVRAAVPDARLVAVGRDRGSFTAHLREIAGPRHEQWLHFAGRIDHDALPHWLARASVCAFPSHAEALGIVCIEAMAAGKAVVASRTGPGPELIEDGVSGLLCDPHAPASIADALIRILTDAGRRRSLAAAARERAVERFSIDRLVTRNVEFYERCLREKR